MLSVIPFSFVSIIFTLKFMPKLEKKKNQFEFIIFLCNIMNVYNILFI